MIKTFLNPFVALPFIFATSCYAQSQEEKQKEVCDTLVSNVTEQLHLDEKEQNEVIIGACKKEPENKNNTIITFATPRKNDYKKNFFIVIVDNRNGRIVATYREIFEEDSVVFFENGSFIIDTANYRLNDKTRAFGIDVIARHFPRCAEGGFSGIRTLYVREGKNIRPILKDIYLDSWRYINEGQSRCNNNPSLPESIVATNKVTLSMADTITNGYRDIIVNTTTSTDDDKTPPKKLKSYKLQYNGKEYPAKKF